MSDDTAEKAFYRIGELAEENAKLKAALLEGWEREGEGKCPLCNIIQDAEDRKRIALEAELRARIKAFDNYVDRARKFRAIAQRAADSLNEGLGT